MDKYSSTDYTSADWAKNNANQAASNANEWQQRAVDNSKEAGLKAEASGQEAVNNARDAAYGKKWEGRTGAKMEEFGDKAQAKTRETLNNAKHGIQDKTNQVQDNFNSNARTDDPSFGDKVQDNLHEAGESIKGGWEKLKDKITGDDNDRVQ